MYRKYISFSLVYVLLIMSAHGESDLWQSCYRLYSANSNRIAGSSSTQVYEVDKEGGIITAVSFNSQITLGTTSVDLHLVSMTRDGKNMSEKELKNEIWWPQGNAENQKTQFNTIELFLDSNSPKVDYTDSGTQKEIRGILCRAFDFKYIKEKNLIYSGTVWIAVEEKAPVSVDFVLVNRPFFISRMYTRTDFIYIDDNNWNLSEMYLEVDAQILFIEKFYKSRIRMYDSMTVKSGINANFMN